MAMTKKKLGPRTPKGPSMPAMAEAVDVPFKRKPSSNVTLRLDREHSGAMPSVKLGQKHTMKVTGKVSSLSSDDYGHRVEMDVRPDGIDHEPDGDGAPASLTQAMKRRNRHMRSGRYV
jgi:hypothetical protein